MHFDMDAFFASIEQAINPRFKGRPLIVGSRNSKFHTVVCAASYEAKAFGITAGMPSIEAFKLCPKLEFIAADQGKYIWTSQEILKILKSYNLPVAYPSIDEFQIDVSGLNNPQELARTIQKQIQERFKITASVGIAKNWILAKLASKLKKPNGLEYITDENLEQILSLVPAKKLCGVGEKTKLILDNLGIKTCLDLYNKSAGFLETNLGATGLNFYYSLRSKDSLNTIQEDDSGPKSVGHSYTFPMVSVNTGFIQAWIRLLSEMIAVRLREQNLTAKTIHIWLNGPEIGNFRAQKSFSEHTSNGQEIYLKALKIMAKNFPKTPQVRALGITCSGLLINNYLPLLAEDKKRGDLSKTIDKINRRFGENTVYPAVIELTQKMK